MVLAPADSNPKRPRLRYRRLTASYAIVRLARDAAIPEWAMKGDFVSLTRTEDEVSIVCPIENLPPDVQSHSCWTCLKLEGPYPVSLTGIIVSFVEPLSNHGIPVFVLSTFDTDYVLQEEIADAATALLQAAAHELLP